LSFLKYAPFVVVLGLFLTVSARAQNVLEGTPYLPVQDASSRGTADAIVTKLYVEQVYDTNLISTQNGQLSGTYTTLEPDVSYVHELPGGLWMFTYRGGGNLYEQSKYSNLDAAANAFRAQIRQSLTKRLSLDLTADWADLPGGAFEENLAEGGTTIQLGTPDDNAEFLARRHITTDATVGLQYQMSPHTYLAWGGSYDDVRYEPKQLLSSSRSEDAFVAYNFQFSSTQTASFGYSNQWIGFPGQGINSQVHNVLFTYSNAFTPTVSFSGYVGPAFVDQVSGAVAGSPTPSSPVETHDVNIVGGASLKLILGHTNIVLRYDRMFSRGSGDAGTALRQTAAINVSQYLTRHLVFALHLNEMNSNMAVFGGQNESSYRIQPTLRYHLTSRLWLTGSEGYVKAIRLGGTTNLDRSITTFGFEYDLPDFRLER
jgi:hypothetical protein